ncbi:hypothetical protein AX17_001915 [Amanita inopinata Kibby_2008]|nr:hypothetical protein AX17_001915 [Amanita inopinata Kibby_2008]
MAEASLLESFPSPPTHIPSSNPPPSLPPSLPLPPLPGPSPISDNFLRRSIVFSRNSIVGNATREDAFLTPPEPLSRLSVSPFPLSDIDDDDDGDDAISTTERPAPRRTHRFNESISDIQLPLADQDDEDDCADNVAHPPNFPMAHSVDPMTLHLESRASRSRNEYHKQTLRARSESPSRAPRQPKEFPPPLPSSSSKATTSEPRPVSPDISTLLSKTPRPRRQYSSVFINLNSHTLPRRVSDGDIAVGHGRRAQTGRRSLNTDYAISFPSRSPDNESEAEERMERELDDDASDSDSSLDLHTPLPRLMVRDGLLSPNSKLLPHPELPFESRASVFSIASSWFMTLSFISLVAYLIIDVSVMTKSGIMKDERDTPRRRNRHRDGRLLRGGIGLTTGLGWSDSEDEDAPSPLTRRLSSLNLSRHSSSRPKPAHPLSRSFSGSRLPEEANERLSYDDAFRQRSNTLSSGSRHPTKTTHPPTSWQNRSQSSSRFSSSSAGSKSSLQLSIPEHSDSATIHQTGVQRSISESDSNLQDTVNTPSTASTLSIPLPSTPSDEPLTRKSAMDKNKSLPPLPTPSLRKLPSKQNFAGNGPRARVRTISSTSSVASAPRSPPTIPLPPVPTTPGGTSTPRPLLLSETHRRQGRTRTPSLRGDGIDRPAVPVPTVSSPNPGLRQLTTTIPSPTLTNTASSLPLSRSFSRLPSKSPRESSITYPSPGHSPKPSSLPSSTSAPDLAKAKPRPRTGTGMTYRTSSYSGLNTAGGSRLLIPKSLTLASTNGSPATTPRSPSTSLPSIRSGTLRTPHSTGIPRVVAS